MLMNMSTMDASHCKLMQKPSVHHGKQIQYNNCTMLTCQSLVATLLDFAHQDFGFIDNSNQPLHFKAYGLSADSYPPIKPPA